jgi:uncharacterized protein YxjI
MTTAAAELLTANTLVVDQKTKVFEMKNEYRIFDENSQQIGYIEQVGQGVLTFLARLGTDYDVLLPVHLEVRDANHQPVLLLHKPFFRMTVNVSHAGSGALIGSIKKKMRLGKAKFELQDPSGQPIGEVNAQNWRARDFKITDVNGQDIAEVNKQWKGVMRELFTDADKFFVRIQPHAQDPIRSLTVAASLAIDIIMKQKDY